MVKDLVPSLNAVVVESGVDPDTLELKVLLHNGKYRPPADKHELLVYDDEGKEAVWKVPSLRELFRGNKVPPDLTKYPPEYVPYLFLVEKYLLGFTKVHSVPTDQQLEEIFSFLRKKPDGRSLGIEHDFFWQVAALLLGTTPLSEAEFTAIFTRLSRSAATWSLKPVSRNYTKYLSETFL